jgi:hypothetical protein
LNKLTLINPNSGSHAGQQPLNGAGQHSKKWRIQKLAKQQDSQGREQPLPCTIEPLQKGQV